MLLTKPQTQVIITRRALDFSSSFSRFKSFCWALLLSSASLLLLPRYISLFLALSLSLSLSLSLLRCCYPRPHHCCCPGTSLSLSLSLLLPSPLHLSLALALSRSRSLCSICPLSLAQTTCARVVSSRLRPQTLVA